MKINLSKFAKTGCPWTSIPSREMDMYEGYTTAELGLMLIKHSEGRVIRPSKQIKEIKAEIEHRAASRGNA